MFKSGCEHLICERSQTHQSSTGPVLSIFRPHTSMNAGRMLKALAFSWIVGKTNLSRNNMHESFGDTTSQLASVIGNTNAFLKHVYSKPSSLKDPEFPGAASSPASSSSPWRRMSRREFPGRSLSIMNLPSGSWELTPMDHCLVQARHDRAWLSKMISLQTSIVNLHTRFGFRLLPFKDLLVKGILKE